MGPPGPLPFVVLESAAAVALPLPTLTFPVSVTPYSGVAP